MLLWDVFKEQKNWFKCNLEKHFLFDNYIHSFHFWWNINLIIVFNKLTSHIFTTNTCWSQISSNWSHLITYFLPGKIRRFLLWISPLYLFCWFGRLVLRSYHSNSWCHANRVGDKKEQIFQLCRIIWRSIWWFLMSFPCKGWFWYWWWWV